ncbi:hypothetical protein Indivirus_7_24 [Indivirus ILV1]|uniref:Uncharacterized protein n=1 Tax=Indivirus ILV1 TaxID=1977633 RepID=A0A1V0SED6_9VIRU|nr:hypothetical protein Indivirus_7_24 [Indivirus ILV1]
MGADVFCIICGGPTYFYSGHGNTLENDVDLNWLNFNTGINNKEQKFEEIGRPDDDYGNYDDFNVMKTAWNDDPDIEGGILAHNDCLKVLENGLNYKLKFVDVHNLVHEYNNLISMADYGEIIEYQEQWFELDDAYKENKWVLLSPLENDRNKERILKTWKALISKFKGKTNTKEGNNKQKNRKGPNESATLFEVGTEKEGNDGNIWVIVVNKNGVKNGKRSKLVVNIIINIVNIR